MEEKILHVGLDVGSTTVKIVVMNNTKEAIYKNYKRHFSDTDLKHFLIKKNLVSIKNA